MRLCTTEYAHACTYDTHPYVRACMQDIHAHVHVHYIVQTMKGFINVYVHVPIHCFKGYTMKYIHTHMAIKYTFHDIICTSLPQFVNVWPKSDLVLLLIFFLLYIMSIIAFGFLVRWAGMSRVSLVSIGYHNDQHRH